MCRARLGWGIGRAGVSLSDGEQRGVSEGVGVCWEGVDGHVDGLMKGGSCQFI